MLTSSYMSTDVEKNLDEIKHMWDTLHESNPDPVLYGPSPKFTNGQLCFWLASNVIFEGHFISISQRIQLKKILTEARMNLLNACKSHPIIQQTRDRARNLNEIPTTTHPEFFDDPIEDDVEDEDDNNDNEDGGGDR